jgi:hypothetical protein
MLPFAAGIAQSVKDEVQLDCRVCFPAGARDFSTLPSGQTDSDAIFI